MAAKPGAPRRKHSAALKAEVIAECRQAGASVAGVALARGLNANLVHHWLRRQAAFAGMDRSLQREVPPTATGEFIALPLSGRVAPTPSPASLPPPPPHPDIRIELRRGAMTMRVAWPTEAARDCSSWLAELLR